MKTANTMTTSNTIKPLVLLNPCSSKAVHFEGPDSQQLARGYPGYGVSLARRSYHHPHSLIRNMCGRHSRRMLLHAVESHPTHRLCKPLSWNLACCHPQQTLCNGTARHNPSPGSSR